MSEISQSGGDLFGMGKAVEKGIDEASAFFRTLLGPLVSEFGLALADPVKDYRKRRAARILNAAKKELEERRVVPQAVPPRILVSLLEAASLEDSDRLQEAWALLLANAADPATASEIHPSFIEIIRQLSPQEVDTLEWLYGLNVSARNCEYGDRTLKHAKPTDTALSLVSDDWFVVRHKADRTTSDLWVQNLYRLGLCEAYPPKSFKSLAQSTDEFCLTDFGERLVLACIRR